MASPFNALIKSLKGYHAMENKSEVYRSIRKELIEKLSGNETAWKSFLRFSGNFYKYSFADQLMIYAQRPDATACASFAVWNNTMLRKIRKNSKGITLFKDEAKGTLRYVFDVSDTEIKSENAPEIPHWVMTEEREQKSHVLYALRKTYSDIPQSLFSFERNISNLVTYQIENLLSLYEDGQGDQKKWNQALILQI